MKRFLGSMMFVALIVLALPLAAAGQQKSSGQANTSEFAKIEKLVWRQFESQENFQRSDLIAREDVEPLLKQLATAGLALKKPDDLLERLVSKNGFLYAELNTNAGRKFMRRIAAYPNGYDRLDRLSRIPRGQQTVHDLIRGRGGERMIEYMATAAGGKELGKMLSEDPGGGNFNAPTGRIYTTGDLLNYLKRQFTAQQKANATAKR